MTIILNGTEKKIDEKTTVGELLKSINMSYQVAVFINDKIVLRRDYDVLTFNEADRVRVFKPMGGG